MLHNIVWKVRVLHGKLHENSEIVKKEISHHARIFRNKCERKKLKRQIFTIISNNCIGGVICHYLGVQFQSPTVNIYIRPYEFVRLCENIDYYMGLPLKEVPYDKRIGYPVAMLGDITLYCKHYASFVEVKKEWMKRKNRINWDHVYFMMTDRDFIPPVSVTKSICSCSEETIKRFDNLPFKNKVCIVQSREYAERYQSCYQLMKGCDVNCTGIITNIIGLTGKRMYQYVKDFDYINFINNGME